MKVPALLAVVAAHAAVADARHTPRHLKKIVNGEEVPVGAYPFMVQLVDVGCGGSVIDAHWVLTAAHCEFQETIVVGAHSWYGMEGQYLQVTANFKHPEYNPDTYDQDFQLLYIEEGIDLEQFPPVVLNTDDSMYPAATSLTIAGWGAVESGGDTPGVLLEATVNVVDQGECHTSYAGAITDNMMCAAAYGTDTCQGDSGGPIFDVKEDGTVVQVGVVSWGNGCADPLYPGVYARVSSQIVWIRETMAEGVQCLDVCCGLSPSSYLLRV
jgi:secreted trypsin-like serine protease